MRYLPLVFAALLFVPSAVAQTYAIDKGSYLLGGTVSFTSQSTDFGFDGDEDDERLTTVVFNPGFAYFVTPGLAIGADILYTSTSFDGNASTSLGIGPQLAYFFGEHESKSYPFVSLGINYSSSDIGIDVSGFGGDVGGGLVFMIARNVGLSAEAFYQFSNLSGDSPFGGEIELDSNTFGVRGGVTAFIF